MIEKITRVTCDWCGYEVDNYLARRKDEVLRHYAENFQLYRFVKVSPLADEMFLKTKDYVPKYLMFCCEECAEKYFSESPDERGHYRKVNVRG
jgi:hypothetical protein